MNSEGTDSQKQSNAPESANRRLREALKEQERTYPGLKMPWWFWALVAQAQIYSVTEFPGWGWFFGILFGSVIAEQVWRDFFTE